MLARLHQLALRAVSGELAALSAHPQALLACLPAFCHILVGATRHLLSMGASGQTAAANGAGTGPDERQVQPAVCLRTLSSHLTLPPTPAQQLKEACLCWLGCSPGVPSHICCVGAVPPDQAADR